MNVFILCTGRSGSKAIITACQYITNFTVGHESRARLFNEERLKYPDNHIEADNRLSWFLGRLDKTYGDSAFYVHQRRAKEPTVKSFVSRWDNQGSIIKSYAEGILIQGYKQISAEERMTIAADYYDTVNENISLFLKDKSQKMTIELESVEKDFEKFYSLINATGDKAKALQSLRNPINTTAQSMPDIKNRIKNKLNRLF